MLSRNFESEFVFKTSRSGGAGGQHVNKVSSKVQLEFDVLSSNLLSAEEKIKIIQKLQSKISKNGILQIIVQTERSQQANKKIAIEKFYKLIEKSLKEEKKRKATKPSGAAKEKRLKEKKKHSEIKGLRRKF